MSSKARRLTNQASIEPFPWLRPALAGPAEVNDSTHLPMAAPIADRLDAHRQTSMPPSDADIAARVEALEREAFAKGYSHGERAGDEAAAARSEVLVQRLAATIDEVSGIRDGMLRRTERDIVRLALAVAERVIHREVSIDHDLLLAMARVAIDRLGERVDATIHLHPIDHADTVAASARGNALPSGVRLVADALIPRGGCIVRTQFGSVDLSLGAQIAELSAALLGPDGADDDSALREAAAAAAPTPRMDSRFSKPVPMPPGLADLTSATRVSA